MGFLVPAAAMIGGAIAIIFSISISLVQGVASMYTSKHFEEYTNDWRNQQFIYVAVIGITLALFAAAVYIASFSTVTCRVSNIIVVSSLTLIGVVFALIDRQYELVRQRMSPQGIIQFLRGKALHLLRDMKRLAKRAAGIISYRTNAESPDHAIALAYSTVLRPSISELDRQLDGLIELSLKLASRGDVEATKYALGAVCSVLSQYLADRQTSSLVMWSNTAVLVPQSDSQAFLAANFERLNEVGETFIKMQSHDLSSQIVLIYASLAKLAAGIEPLSKARENPILDQMIGYLDLYIQRAITAKDTEPVFQGARAFGSIAALAAEKGLQVTLFGLQEKLQVLGVASLGLQTTAVTDQCYSAMLELLKAIFISTEILRAQPIEMALTGLATTTAQLNAFIVVTSSWGDYGTTQVLCKGYVELLDVFVVIGNRYDRFTQDQEGEKKKYRADVIAFFEVLRSSLRRLAEDVESCDTFLSGTVGRLVFYTNQFIVGLIESDDFTETEKAKLREQVKYTAYTPYWFVDEAKTFNVDATSFDDLVEGVARTGVLVTVKLADQAIVEACIDSIYATSKQALEKGVDPYGYSTSRIMVKACCLGVLALRAGWLDTVEALKLKVREFEDKYATKYPGDGAPQGSRLFTELSAWYSSFDYDKLNGATGVTGDAKDMMYGITEAADIERFINQVWGS